MNPSNLTERLRAIVGATHGAVQPGVPGCSPSSPRATSDKSGPTYAGAEGKSDEILGGQWLDHAAGRSFVVERRLRDDAQYGRVTVGELAHWLKRAAAFAPTLAGGAPARPPFVFFDLETTGLNGGAGTLAFLVGCARFDDDGGFVTRQHLLTGFGDEPGMLNAVARDLEVAGALVSFNGKSFDAPVLETRYLFHRLEWSGARVPHIDVLHPSRRFWRRNFYDISSCSLGVLEQQLFGLRRTGDVAGFEIPTRFFEFVRSGNTRFLAGVLEHNRHDLLSLAAISAKLLGLLADGPARALDAVEALALGRAYARAGFESRAHESFERALTMMEVAVGATRRFPVPLLKVEALRALAYAARRNRRHDVAAARWQQVLDIPGCPSNIVREATEALAIHNEHRSRDLGAAKAFALRSLKSDARPAWRDALHHRLARIERKMERNAERPSLLDCLARFPGDA